jgi:para-nitrobenzyl esterase
MLLCLAVTACTEKPQLRIGDSLLHGEQLEGSQVVAFRGISFAEPPLGELRWQKPVPVQTITQYGDANEFAPACMQSMRILDWYRGLAETFGATRDVFDDLVTSEDCLYLNIWSPDLKADSALPVMVYVHGGSNKSGWSYEPNYSGHVLAAEGAVIVSIAYRLGVFGFLSHPDLSDSTAVANFALWDQIVALKWIQENIQHFGGDTRRVILFGESSGAQNILALMTSDEAAGLFHGAILQSTAGFGAGRSSLLEDEQERGVKTAQLFGFDGPDSLQKLRSVPAADLLRAYEEEFSDYYHSPAVDGQLLEKPVWDVITGGNLAEIPFIIGSNADEWYSSTAEDSTAEDVKKAVESSDRLNSPAALEAVADETDYREALDRILTAEAMLCPSLYLATNQNELNIDAWVYHFSRVRDGAAGSSLRAYHGAELPFVFGTHDSWMTTTEVDWQLSENIMAYWLQFAKTGNPNSPGLPEWPTFSAGNDKVMNFANEPALASPPDPVLCSVFRKSVGQEAG